MSRNPLRPGPQRGWASLMGAAAAAGLAAAGAASTACAAPAADAAPENVLHLSASATRQVAQDWLTVVFATSREGPEPGALQTQLKQALDGALAEARRAAAGLPAQALELQTGGFSLQPRYGRDGRMSGWTGRAELVVQGRDTVAIAQLAGRIQTLAVASTGFSLSREARERVEDEVAAEAVTRYRDRAAALARQFGFAGYELREVTLQSDAPMQPFPRVQAMRASAAMADEALPVEAGKASVTITVNGSVRLTR